MDLRLRRGLLSNGAPAEDEEDSKRRRRRLLLLLLLLLLLFGFLMLFWWAPLPRANARSDRAEVILLAAPKSAALTYDNMAPGDAVTRRVVVTNAGFASVRYAVASTTTDRLLSQQLELTIKTEVTRCTNDGFAMDGETLYGPGPLGRQTSLLLFGPARNADRSRPIAAGDRDELCFRVELPLYAGSTFEQTDATASFCFAPSDRLAREIAEASRSGKPIAC
jgi:hypothetical protein